MVDICILAMVLLLGAAQLGRLLGLARDRPAVKWLLVAMNLAAVMFALAFLLGFQLQAPVPAFVPISAALVGFAMCCGGLYLRSRQPLSRGS